MKGALNADGIARWRALSLAGLHGVKPLRVLLAQRGGNLLGLPLALSRRRHGGTLGRRTAHFTVRLRKAGGATRRVFSLGRRLWRFHRVKAWVLAPVEWVVRPAIPWHQWRVERLGRQHRREFSL